MFKNLKSEARMLSSPQIHAEFKFQHGLAS